MEYTIKLCEKKDSPLLRKFIDEVWSKDHILARNKDLLDWQYGDEQSHTYNFIVCHDLQNNRFVSVLGFIPLTQYDSSLEAYKNYWFALWKTDLNCLGSNGLGLKLFSHFMETYRPVFIGIAGISEVALQIYKLLGFKTGLMKQYCFLNHSHRKYELVLPEGYQYFDSLPASEAFLKEINRAELQGLRLSSDLQPEKSLIYFINRYAKHPSYDYRFYGLYNQKGDLINLFVMRKISIGQASCIRIVDMFCDIKNVPFLGDEFNRILNVEKAEYMDCLNYGLSEDDFAKIGLLPKNSTMVVPNYFEPFEKRNVDISIAYLCNQAKEDCRYVFFKGDGDQDRPNI